LTDIARRVAVGSDALVDLPRLDTLERTAGGGQAAGKGGRL
jgi:hypothetical protein